MRLREKIFLITALFYTIVIIFPLFSDMVRLPVWLPSILSSAIMMALYPNAFKNKIMMWFLIYAAVLGFFVLVGKPLTIGIGTVVDSKKILIEFAYILPTISMFSIFCYLQDYELTKKYVTWSAVFLYVSFIITVPLMVKYNSLREALGEQSEVLVIPGLPSYSLMHAYTLFLPVVCYAVKATKRFKRLLCILALLLLCYVIYSTFVTTSLLVMLAILLFTFIYSDKLTSNYWVTFAFLGFVFLFLYEVGFFIDVIDAVYPYFEGTAVEEKLIDFRDSMVGGELQGDTIESRQHLHEKSWNSFFSNPLWGTSIIGGHSSLLDRFGGMGLLGGLPFLMIFVSFYRITNKMLNNSFSRFLLLIGLLAGMLFLYQKGNWGCESWLMLMVMMPMGLLVFDNPDFVNDSP